MPWGGLALSSVYSAVNPPFPRVLTLSTNSANVRPPGLSQWSESSSEKPELAEDRANGDAERNQNKCFDEFAK